MNRNQLINYILNNSAAGQVQPAAALRDSLSVRSNRELQTIVNMIQQNHDPTRERRGREGRTGSTRPALARQVVEG